MKARKIGATNRFETLAEVNRYLDIMNVKKINLNELTSQDNKNDAYILDNMLMKYNPEYQSLYVYGGFSQEVIDLLKTSHYKSYFYKNNILNLEGLIYLHTFLNCEPEDLINEYDKLFYDIRYNNLLYELNNFINVFNSRKTLNDDIIEPEIVKELRNNIELLINIIYPFNNIEFINNLNSFVNITQFNAASINDTIKFKWKFKTDYTTTIKCKYYQKDNDLLVSVAIFHDSKTFDEVTYRILNNNEVIQYHTRDNINDLLADISLNNNLLSIDEEITFANENDYHKINDIIKTYINLIIDKLPYLNPKITNENNKQK